MTSIENDTLPRSSKVSVTIFNSTGDMNHGKSEFHLLPTKVHKGNWFLSLMDFIDWLNSNAEVGSWVFFMGKLSNVLITKRASQSAQIVYRT